MSYEIWAFDAAQVSTADAAGKAWEESTYENSSLPDHDRTARKWQIKDEVLAFNSALIFREPAPKGLLSKLAADSDETRYLVLCRPPAVSTVDDDGRGIDFCIYDQAIEIEFPWSAERDAVEGIVRDAWRHLEKLSQLGFGRFYDTERSTLLDLDADFDAVLKCYIENLELDEEDAAPEPLASGTGRSRPPDAEAPFSGNVVDSKPWWKLW
jgi:hypothetical protein